MAGLTLSNRFPDAASTSSPSMSMRTSPCTVPGRSVSIVAMWCSVREYVVDRFGDLGVVEKLAPNRTPAAGPRAGRQRMIGRVPSSGAGRRDRCAPRRSRPGSTARSRGRRPGRRRGRRGPGVGRARSASTPSPRRCSARRSLGPAGAQRADVADRARQGLGEHGAGGREAVVEHDEGIARTEDRQLARQRPRPTGRHPPTRAMRPGSGGRRRAAAAPTITSLVTGIVASTSV